ncbi:hypothetical protein SAMN05216603_12332 [Pseudomonas benzenivorans]|nr:hypothetical protein [Pseudomonas benzenivorans]SDI15865.1 hypothetical protein SAMN05216603_12332 [Pseudomonas benzenivorans]
MSTLLDCAIAAHGGWDRWQQIGMLTAHVNIGGAIWHVKGWPDVFADARVSIDPHHQHTEYTPFQKVGQHTLFESGRVAIIAGDGKVIEERPSPREAFAGHALTTPWDALHLAYFAGYAMWTYLATPFLFKLPGFQVEEIEPWEENGEIWRRLKVTSPDGFHGHTREQTFYFNPAGLLRRHDYSVDIMGSGATSAHYVSDHKTFGGLVFPTQRRVYPTTSDNKPTLDQVLVSIDIRSVDVT